MLGEAPRRYIVIRAVFHVADDVPGVCGRAGGGNVHRLGDLPCDPGRDVDGLPIDSDFPGSRSCSRESLPIQ